MRDKNKPDSKFCYKSILTGEYILPHQWIAEVLVDRKSKNKRVNLPDRFWLDKDSEWCKEFKRQTQKAAQLIKKYSEEAILNFIKKNPFKFSLLTKDNIEKIEQEQYRIDERSIVQKVETQDAFSYIQPKSHKKTLLGKLNVNKKKT